MSPKTLKELVAYPWRPTITEEPDGGFRLTVTSLLDFELFADTREELDRTWREALESHLQGYLATGKAIPLPGARIVEAGATATHGRMNAQRIVFDDFKLAPC